LTREYDPWGNLLQGSMAGGYVFTGRERDSELGLYYYRARYYPGEKGGPVRYGLKAMRTVTLDEDLAALVEGEKSLAEATREALVMDLFRRRKISTGKACELLRLDRLDFLRCANEHDVPVCLTTEDEWEREKATIDSWLKPQMTARSFSRSDQARVQRIATSTAPASTDRWPKP
jgi:hypothetical protein